MTAFDLLIHSVLTFLHNAMHNSVSTHYMCSKQLLLITQQQLRVGTFHITCPQIYLRRSCLFKIPPTPSVMLHQKTNQLQHHQSVSMPLLGQSALCVPLLQVTGQSIDSILVPAFFAVHGNLLAGTPALGLPLCNHWFSSKGCPPCATMPGTHHARHGIKPFPSFVL